MSIGTGWANGAWVTSAFKGSAWEGGDTTAPILTLATGTTIDSVSASGTVTTDEQNGDLYWIATTSATPPAAATIISDGSTQAIT